MVSSGEIATAYHEAGHAVACYVFNIKLQDVSIQSEQQGCTNRSPLLTDDDATDYAQKVRLGRDRRNAQKYRIRMEHEIIMCMAGSVAERKFDPKTYDYFYSMSDYDVIDEFMLLFTEDDFNPDYMKSLEGKAEQLVKEHWPKISALSDALVEHRTLTGEQVGKILRAFYKEE